MNERTRTALVWTVVGALALLILIPLFGLFRPPDSGWGQNNRAWADDEFFMGLYLACLSGAFTLLTVLAAVHLYNRQKVDESDRMAQVLEDSRMALERTFDHEREMRREDRRRDALGKLASGLRGLYVAFNAELLKPSDVYSRGDAAKAWGGEAGAHVILRTGSPSHIAMRNLMRALERWWEVDTRMDLSDPENFAHMNARCAHIAIVASMALAAVEHEWHDDLLGDDLIPMEVPDIPADSTLFPFHRVYKTEKPPPSEKEQGSPV